MVPFIFFAKAGVRRKREVRDSVDGSFSTGAFSGACFTSEDVLLGSEAVGFVTAF